MLLAIRRLGGERSLGLERRDDRRERILQLVTEHRQELVLAAVGLGTLRDLHL